jgi:lysophospholipase L1-like esterase
MAALSVIRDSARIIVKSHPLGFRKNKIWQEVEVLFGAVPLGGTLKIYGQVSDTLITDIPPSSEGEHYYVKRRLKGENEDLVISVEGYSVEITGIRLGSSNGVQIHNIPMRGSSGTIFSRLNHKHFKDYLQNWDVGMFILQYGGNAAPYVSDSSSAERYGKRFGKQIRYIRSILPEATVLVIGPSDMGQTLDSTNLSYPMLGSIRNAMREATIKEGGLFWDLSDVMGGPGTMEAWATATPKLASPDLVHFTVKGSRRIGEALDRSFRAEYRTWEDEIRANKK